MKPPLPPRDWISRRAANHRRISSAFGNALHVTCAHGSPVANATLAYSPEMPHEVPHALNHISVEPHLTVDKFSHDGLRITLYAELSHFEYIYTMKTHGMRRCHAISSGFSGHYQDLDISSYKLHFILAWSSNLNCESYRR